MKKYGIFYGSATGVTASIAKKIGDYLGVDQAEIHDVSQSSPDMFGDYEVLVLGTSTWGDGEIEEDWYDMLAGVEVLDLKDKKIALFGCGDENMSDTFCNGVGELYRRLKPTGATFVGAFNTLGYDFNHTDAEVDGQIVGLLLDEANKPELSDEKITAWVALLKTQTE
ncbi:MAG: flavodoxin [Muribaculaceae bacterium]|nr:flavodoxin [Muribaculaceae bacterium]